MSLVYRRRASIAVDVVLFLSFPPFLTSYFIFAIGGNCAFLYSVPSTPLASYLPPPPGSNNIGGRSSVSHFTCAADCTTAASTRQCRHVHNIPFEPGMKLLLPPGNPQPTGKRTTPTTAIRPEVLAPVTDHSALPLAQHAPKPSGWFRPYQKSRVSQIFRISFKDNLKVIRTLFSAIPFAAFILLSRVIRFKKGSRK